MLQWEWLGRLKWCATGYDELVSCFLHLVGLRESGPPIFFCTRCKTCPYISNMVKISGPNRSAKSTDHFTCILVNVLYCITCTLCTKIYTGETGGRMAHRFSVWCGKTIWECYSTYVCMKFKFDFDSVNLLFRLYGKVWFHLRFTNRYRVKYLPSLPPRQRTCGLLRNKSQNHSLQGSRWTIYTCDKTSKGQFQ